MDNRIQILPTTNTADGVRYVKMYHFDIGSDVPVYDVATTGALNQLIGYAKYLNQGYGNVYYRGVSHLFGNVRPAVMRERTWGDANDLNRLLKLCHDDPYLKSSLNLIRYRKPRTQEDYHRNKILLQINKSIIEGIIQHYSGCTRFLDVVDNHWVALWMGLQKFESCGEGGMYMNCTPRVLELNDFLQHIERQEHGDSKVSFPVSELYEYILLIAMPLSTEPPMRGVTLTTDMIEVDLRKALPSFYLRPHAQHALVVRKRQPVEGKHLASSYDMASQVIGIIRVRVDNAKRWLGNGQLVTKENLFPSPSIDSGYNSLLKNEIFQKPDIKNRFGIKLYF